MVSLLLLLALSLSLSLSAECIMFYHIMWEQGDEEATKSGYKSVEPFKKKGGFKAASFAFGKLFKLFICFFFKIKHLLLRFMISKSKILFLPIQKKDFFCWTKQCIYSEYGATRIFVCSIICKYTLPDILFLMKKTHTENHIILHKEWISCFYILLAWSRFLCRTFLFFGYPKILVNLQSRSPKYYKFLFLPFYFWIDVIILFFHF